MKRTAIIAAALAATVFSGAGSLGLGAARAAEMEPLQGWTAMLSHDPEGHAPAFSYIAPPRGSFRNLPREELRLLGSGGLPPPVNELLFEEDRDAGIRELTGLDFSSVAAFVVVGGPPDTILALAIPGTDPEAVTAAYAARGFERAEIAGQPVHHVDEDRNFRIARRNTADPFGRNLGIAQRVALVGDTVVSATGWGPFWPAVAALAVQDGCTGCLPWRAMLDALDAATDGAYLETASGWPAASSFRVEDLSGLDADAAALPAFTLAMFAVTAAGDRRAPHLIVYFPDAGTAEAGAAEIARRLTTGLSLSGRSAPEQRVEATLVHPDAATGGAVAVLTIDADGSMEAAYGASNRWVDGIMMRDFRPLAFD